MNYLWGIFLVLCLLSGMTNAETKNNLSKIGSTFTAPISFDGKYYFVTASGVLFESEKDFSKLTQLFAGKKSSLGAVTLFEHKLIWGDGLKNDLKSTLHIFDLKSKKLLKALEVDGHIERAPLVHAGLIYFAQGHAGLQALDAQSLVMKWQTSIHNNKKLHVDSNILPLDDKVCATTLFDLKGVFCLNAKNGKITQFAPLMRDPKSEIALWKNQIVGFATEGDLTKAKWDIPSDLFIYDIKSDKISMSKELRGFNFYAPAISGDEAFITLSTGDFILLNLVDGKISFLGEFSEPFTNNAFRRGEDYCGVGLMGKYNCYGRSKIGFTQTVDKRLGETVLGRVSVQDSKIIVPSSAGFYHE